ncbi:ribonuclease H-like domain-containing protein [Arenimonas sp.]|uniref:ribonuclease H-like domain-containing protein n=1 Tax=Arenimonas sp. TaxID=1872635 RepID=UPI002E344234|nr:ribonuclease H-like domain-containing protein [Arenimonas sp.]HEX4853386.1 ribonuclease H-like domain-containing protein [Arenimonas sp.]
MSATLERLRELRQQAGTVAPPAPNAVRVRPCDAVAVDAVRAPRSEVPEHIRRLLGLRERLRLPRPAPTPPSLASDRHVPGEEIEAGLHYVEQLTPWRDVPATIDASFGKLGTFARGQLLHFDTETTGLAGGTGTRAFMIGAADWQPEGLRLRQLTITTLTAEAAMLRHFAGWLAPDTVLVSYNGKCYDAPLLNTRYRLARLPSPLPGRPHLDLLHPSRRRWKGRWENCRLGTVERQVLGVVREDDLPGSEAPRAWLDYLRGGSARDLRRVADHNAQDLRSLAALCLHLAT